MSTMQRAIPYMQLRGGSSKGLYFKASDLPADPDLRDRVILIGQLNSPVAMGGTIIYPGDIVVMDADGAITVRPSRLDDVLEKSEARAVKEEADRARFKNGERSYDIRGWRELVEAPR